MNPITPVRIVSQNAHQDHGHFSHGSGSMNNFFVKKTLFVAATGLALQASAAQANVSLICPTYNQAKQTLSVKVGTGCTTGMARLKEQNLQLAVDQDRALITVSGQITFHEIANRIVTADCAGAKHFTLHQDDVQPRRYSIAYNNQSLGIVDLLEGAEQTECLRTSRTKLGASAGLVIPKNFHSWAFDADGAWTHWTGASVTALLEPILGNHPEGLEGSPEVTVRMKKARWRDMSLKRQFMRIQTILAVEIERHGFADHSASGDRYFVAVAQTQDGWKVERLWSQQMCARGEFAGQWTSADCP
jgi:hypothetical protein